VAQYTDMRSTWGGREGSYREDHYPYAWRDVVDDSVHKEDFQDVHDENNHVPWYPSFYGNVYDWTEHYPVSPPFRIVNEMMRGGFVHESLEMMLT
jgi:hypothetical protein